MNKWNRTWNCDRFEDHIPVVLTLWPIRRTYLLQIMTDLRKLWLVWKTFWLENVANLSFCWSLYQRNHPQGRSPPLRQWSIFPPISEFFLHCQEKFRRLLFSVWLFPQNCLFIRQHFWWPFFSHRLKHNVSISHTCII